PAHTSPPRPAYQTAQRHHLRMCEPRCQAFVSDLVKSPVMVGRFVGYSIASRLFATCENARWWLARVERRQISWPRWLPNPSRLTQCRRHAFDAITLRRHYVTAANTTGSATTSPLPWR